MGNCPMCNGLSTGGILCDVCRDVGYRRQRKGRSNTQREKIINAAPSGTRYCSSCEEYLALEKFYDWDARGIGRCKKCKRENTAKHHKRKKEARKCLHCGIDLRKEENNTCEKCKVKNLKRYYDRRDVYSSIGADRRFQLKMDALNKYGGPICVCCGETEFKFLSMDHINNDGASHRKKIKEELGYVGSVYQWLKNNNYPPGLQVLCFNCNLSKGHYGACPHDIQNTYLPKGKQLSQEEIFSLKNDIEQIKFRIDQWIRPHNTKEGE